MRSPVPAFKKSRVKQLIAQLLAVVGAVLVLGALAGAARVIVKSQTGADGASALHEVPELPAEADRQVSWLPDAWKRERVLEPGTRIALEAAYLRAWAALGVYQSTGDSRPLIATFAGPARQQALALPTTQGGGTWSISHQLRLEFYALDGATVALTDLEARTVRRVGSADDETVLDSVDSYGVVMALEDGYWRLRQLRRLTSISARAVHWSTGTWTATTGVADGVAAPLVPTLATRYVPPGWPERETGADGAKESWPALMAAELGTVKALGFTSVRVVMPYETVDGLVGSISPYRMDALRAVLNQAQATGVSVLLTLFDGATDLSPDSWFAADAYVREVASAVGQHPALALVDLGERLEDRTSSAAPAEIIAFAIHTAETWRSVASTPLTATWHDLAFAADAGLVRPFNIVSLAVDGCPPDLGTQINRVQVAAAGKPVLVVADAVATQPGASPRLTNERRQQAEVSCLLDRHLDQQAMLSVARFHDVGEDRHGLVRADGTRKLAAALISAPPGRPLPIAVGEFLHSPFWLGVSGLLGLTLLLAMWRIADGLLPERLRPRRIRPIRGIPRLRRRGRPDQ